MSTLATRWPYGHALRVIRTIRNDGSHRDLAKGAVLVRRGEIGTVIRSGPYLADEWVYELSFADSGRIVGCLSKELQEADAPFIATLFVRGDKPRLTITLTSQGQQLAQKGQCVEILGLESLTPEVTYWVQCSDQDFILAETYLEAASL